MTIQKMANNLKMRPAEVYWLVPAVALDINIKNVFITNEEVGQIEILDEDLALESLPVKKKQKNFPPKQAIDPEKKEEDRKARQWKKDKKDGRYCKYCKKHFYPSRACNVFCKSLCRKNFNLEEERKKTRAKPKKKRGHPKGFDEKEDQIFNSKKARKEADEIMKCSTECLLRELGDIE